MHVHLGMFIFSEYYPLSSISIDNVCQYAYSSDSIPNAILECALWKLQANLKYSEVNTQEILNLKYSGTHIPVILSTQSIH